MNSVFNTFPTIDNLECFDDINIVLDENILFYTDQYGNLIELSRDIDNGKYSIKDDKYGNWNFENDDLLVCKRISIEKPYLIFGENGVVDEDSTISIACIWTSKSSDVRGVIEEFGTIKGEKYIESKKKINVPCSKDSFITNICFKFNKNIAREKIEMEFVIYLKDNFNKDERFANSRGSILYRSPIETLILSGSGSFFPIYKVSRSSNYPLWTIEYNGTDPQIDSFSDDLYLNVNINNKDYDQLQLEMELSENKSCLFKEMISSFYIQMICRVKEMGLENSLYDNEENEEGSISRALKYFIDSYGINISNINKLADDIRKVIGENL